MNSKILNSLDQLALFILIIASYSAFILQITSNELPCALCVMQRMGLYAISFGLILNLIKSRDQKNYLLIIISALFTSFMSLVQVLLHIVPGTGSFGDAFLGLHLYTWTFVLCICFILYASLAGLYYVKPATELKPQNILVKMLVIFLILSLIINILSAFIECGPYLCPSDPHSYWLIDLIKGNPWI